VGHESRLCLSENMFVEIRENPNPEKGNKTVEVVNICSVEDCQRTGTYRFYSGIEKNWFFTCSLHKNYGIERENSGKRRQILESSHGLKSPQNRSEKSYKKIPHSLVK
jgi:hypothetical protein